MEPATEFGITNLVVSSITRLSHRLSRCFMECNTHLREAMVDVNMGMLPGALLHTYPIINMPQYCYCAL